MKTLALRQKYSELCDRQQVITDKAASEVRALTTDETTQFNALDAEMKGIWATIQSIEAADTRAQELDRPMGGKVYRPAADVGTKDKLDDGGFKNVGELLYGIKFGDPKGRIKNLVSTDVGILIPPAFSQTIMALDAEAEIVMPRATVIPVGSPPDGQFSVPYLTQGANGALGGVALTWTAEDNAMTDAGDPDIKDLALEPREVSGLATITNKTLQNWEAAGGFVETLLRKAFVTGRDYKFIRGKGVGCPLGVQEAPGKILVNRNTASTVKYIDVVTMMSRLHPESLANALFVASITCLPALMTMTDDEGQFIFVRGDATKGVPATLAGVPLKFTGKVPTKGNQGDLMLVDFSAYLIKPGSGPFVALSEHVYFTTNKTVFRIVANIDGQPWVKDPLLLEDGSTTVSPYVILK